MRVVGVLGIATAVKEWSWLQRRSPHPPQTAPAQPKGLLVGLHPGMRGMRQGGALGGVPTFPCSPHPTMRLHWWHNQRHQEESRQLPRVQQH